MELRDQVRWKKQLSNGNQILFGTIVSFKDATKKVAIVSVQQDVRKPRSIAASARIEMPVDKLELVKGMFGGRAVVHSNPTHRSLGSLVSQLNKR